jgi:antitoxin ParD1/3/4
VAERQRFPLLLSGPARRDIAGILKRSFQEFGEAAAERGVVPQIDTRTFLWHGCGMPIGISLNVSLTPELGEFIESRVASGRYQTASEVIREGLRLLEEREQMREAALEELRAKLRHGIEQADRNELLDGDAVFEEVRQLSARHRAESLK